jgi:hypothetical protein
MDSTLTQNKNYLPPTGFRVTINSQKFANLEYFCTQVNIPSVGLNAVATPFRGHEAFMAGDRINYTPFDMRFIVSENMENYVELLGWMKQNQANSIFTKSDVILTLLNSHNNKVKQIRFIDAFPVSIGAVDFHTQNTDIEYVSIDASFQYTYFEVL